MFSGRRDPAWAVSGANAAKLIQLWDRLDPFHGSKPVPPPLGYRGCSIESPDGMRWEAFGGVVRSGDELRADPGGVFEKAVLKSAPAVMRYPLGPAG
jgi:hypothetical protein